MQRGHFAHRGGNFTFKDGADICNGALQTFRTYINGKINLESRKLLESQSPRQIAAIIFPMGMRLDLTFRSQEGCAPSEAIAIKLGRSIEAGAQVTLTLAYTGELSHSQGVYRSKTFRDLDAGQDTVLLVTQLEQTGARHMFPCIDEPSSKVQTQRLSSHNLHAHRGGWRSSSY